MDNLLPPPGYLSPSERDLFIQIARAAPYLSAAHIPLMVNYVKATNTLKDMDVMEDSNSWWRLVRAQVRLAKSLGLIGC